MTVISFLWHNFPSVKEISILWKEFPSCGRKFRSETVFFSCDRNYLPVTGIAFMWQKFTSMSGKSFLWLEFPSCEMNCLAVAGISFLWHEFPYKILQICRFPYNNFLHFFLCFTFSWKLWHKCADYWPNFLWDFTYFLRGIPVLPRGK